MTTNAVRPVNHPAAGSPWWQPVRFEWGVIEMLVMRLGFAALFFENINWSTSPYTEQKFPNGIAHLFDLTWIGHHPAGMMTQGMVAAFLLLYVVGFLPALGLLPVSFFAVVIGTLMNSQGAINHAWQMVTMMGLAQLLVYAWPRRGAGGLVWSQVFRPDIERHRQAAWAALVVIAASYFVCGIVKLVNSDGMWLVNAPYLAVQMLKTNYSAYYDTLQAPPVWLSDITQALVDHPNLARLMFGGGLLIELAGFVVLINRRWAFVGGLAIIALHLSISHLMNLNFEAHMVAALIYLVNIPGVMKMWRGAA